MLIKCTSSRKHKQSVVFFMRNMPREKMTVTFVSDNKTLNM